MRLNDDGLSLGGIVKTYLSHDGLNSHDYDLFSKSLNQRESVG